MLSDILSALSRDTGFALSGSSASGTYNGYGVRVNAIEEKMCFIVTVWARKGALANSSVDDFVTEYSHRPGNDYVKASRTSGYTTDVILTADDDAEASAKRIHTFIEELTEFMQLNYYNNACAKCGSSIGLSIYGGGASGTQLCSMCAQKEGAQATQAQQPFAQPQQAYTQPQQQAYTQPQQPYAQPQQAYAQPQQPYAQPMQGVMVGQVGQVGQVAQVGQVGQVGAATDAPAMSVSELGASDRMGSVSLENTPESTGYTTAEQFDALQPTAPVVATDYQPTPIPGDFRSAPEFATNNYSTASVNYEPIKSNPIMGFVGAILFTLIACAIWIVIGMLGFISWWGGLAMGFCCVTGYRLLGKKFDVYGIICCIIIILFAVLGCNIFVQVLSVVNDSDAMEVAAAIGYEDFGSLFFGFFGFMSQIDELAAAIAPDAANMMASFIKDLVISYLFAGVGFCVIGIPQYRAGKAFTPRS